MGNDVFANGREVSCKAADGKAICAFPDVCFTPPESPVTPPGVPIPYPNTGMASDTTNGTKSVKVSGKEVMLKNKSYFKKSTGDEAGCATKKGFVTSTNRGKIYFSSWSMDVHFEDENVVRHLDLTTHNHMSLPGNSPPWPYLDSMSLPDRSKCNNNIEDERKSCGFNDETKKYEMDAEESCKNKKCQEARKCMLLPYRVKNPETNKNESTCCDGQTGHHLVEVHGFMHDRKRRKDLPQFPNYNENDAPCVCAECPSGSRFLGEHGDLHAVQGVLELGAMGRAKPDMKKLAWNYKEAREAGVKAHSATFPGSKCNPDCIAAQINSYHQKETMNVSDNTPLRTGPGALGKKYGSQWLRGLELLERLAKRMKQLSGF